MTQPCSGFTPSFAELAQLQKCANNSPYDKRPCPRIERASNIPNTFLPSSELLNCSPNCKDVHRTSCGHGGPYFREEASPVCRCTTTCPLRSHHQLTNLPRSESTSQTRSTAASTTADAANVATTTTSPRSSPAPVSPAAPK